MAKNGTGQRTPFRREIYMDELGEVYLTISGEFGLKIASSKLFCRPTQEETSQMLDELRRQHQWSQSMLAAMMGVSKYTVRRWIDGTRSPCCASVKLIWIMHQIFVKRTLPSNGLDWLLWGAGDKVRYDFVEDFAQPEREQG